ncbi:hypothetical protein OG897_16055 [Streptomyces sp. NBC_00237]|uniref:hypothetical protein n=1 Tax=Streptomyces sp. NBC_00237 TaxID=2975687 RepID=UPI002257C336|nr:hypothetical protein [Streptomyces sp. NBC_00237]MCX5202958.1 hypothetical protein [Streptomyces sp. NBC_00237]
MGDLVKGMVEPVAKRWSAVMGGPLLLWWLAGLVLVLHQRGGPATACREPGVLLSVPCRLQERGAAGQAVLAAALIAVVVLSALASSALAGPLLEVLSGRWGTSRIAVAVTRVRTRRHRDRRTALRRGRLPAPARAGTDPAAWDVQEGWRAARAAAAWARYPRRTEDLRPTAVGNALVGLTAEVQRAYGLRLAVCWGPFTEALEQSARDRLATAATRVLGRAQALLCAAAGGVWVFLLPGVVAKAVWLVVCVGCCWGAHRALRAGVDAYCVQVMDAVTVHRARLYRAVGLPLPATTAEERASGESLSRALAMRLEGAVPHDWPTV